ncbi:MAG: helix-turn-helix domain-containing protein [Candidatus Diapherotrites archaeon]
MAPDSATTEVQKQIAALLFNEPKTIEELHKKLGISEGEIMGHLKAMLRLGVVEKQDGFPVKYGLISQISDSVRKRKEIGETDAYKLRIKAVIEVQALEETLLKKALGDIEAALRKEKDFTVYDVLVAEPVEDGEHFSSYMEVNLSLRNFRALVKFMYFYGPSSVEVIKPAKFEILLHDLQDGLMDMAEMIQSYNRYVLNLMSKKELEELSRKLYDKRP